MKKYLYLLALSLSSVAANAQGSSGLVGHWNFNGNANDVSGNGFNGTVSGAALVPGYNSIANTAYTFRGLNAGTGEYEHIDIAYNAAMDVSRFSICTLVKIDSFSADLCNSSALLWRGYQGSGNYYSLALNDNVNDNDCYQFSPTQSNYVGELGDLAWGLSPLSRGYSNYAVANSWACVIETFDGDSMKIYINGVLSNSIYYPYTLGSGADGLRIGASTFNITGPGMHGYPFYGSIDDIKLYGRALSASEVDMYCEEAKSGGGDPGNGGDGGTDWPTSVAGVSVNNMVVAPNPATDKIQVFMQTATKGKIQLLNTVGQVLAERPIEGSSMQFDLNNYASGLYMIRVQSANGKISVSKFLKQ